MLKGETTIKQKHNNMTCCITEYSYEYSFQRSKKNKRG